MQIRSVTKYNFFDKSTLKKILRVDFKMTQDFLRLFWGKYEGKTGKNSINKILDLQNKIHEKEQILKITQIFLIDLDKIRPKNSKKWEMNPVP